MDFAARPPSVAWEPVPVPERAGCVVWVWFKPQGAQSDVMVNVPPETLAAYGASLSLRRLIPLIGLPFEAVESWTVQGATYAAQAGANPLLDQPLPPPGPWGDPGISVRMAATASPSAPVPIASPPLPSAPDTTPISPPAAVTLPADGHTDRLLHAFDANWHALLAVEIQLALARKQLGTIQGQLQSLNRDLSSDENLAADNQDRKDWQDARRWLRDSLSTVSRWIRDHDIGMVSAAGNRNRFEQIYQHHVEPRKPYAGLAAAHQEFEQHRKMAQNVLIQMRSAYQSASSDGVNRARQLLNRIAGKVRKDRENRGTR